MASWLKAAEDLFEVVDRRAKLVAGELSEEQPDLKPPASNGSEFQGQRTKMKKPRAGSSDSPRPNDIAKEKTPKTSDIVKEKGPSRSDIAKEQTSIKASAADNLVPNFAKMNSPFENAGTVSSNDAIQTAKEVQLDMKKDETSSDNCLIEKQPTIDKHDRANKMQAAVITDGLEATVSSINGEITNENMPDGREMPSSDSMESRVEAIDGDIPVHSLHNVMPRDDDDVSLKIDQEGHVLQSPEKPTTNDNQAKESLQMEEPYLDARNQAETKTDPVPMRVQDQLDEAQGLLKTTVSTGQSKEARLARVCAGLSSRLQEYKLENAQLEELLIGERERSNSYESYIKNLQQDLSASKIEVSRAESNIAEALAAKNSEIETLVSSLDTLKKQSVASEAQLASLQANLESIMRNRELTETRVMQAIREELAVAERRAEEERAGHNSTKMAAMEREVELEQRAVEASTALARMQRVVDERTSKATELEQKLAVVEAECASLSQELQDMEARARRGQKRSSEEASQALQVQAWQEEVERARQGQRDAESKVSLLEAEIQKLRVEMAGMRRDAEHYSRQEHMELEKRYRELTDLLYHKQTQLEAMASEKAAVEFQMEKEVKRLQEAQMETERNRVSRRASSSWEEDSDLKALEPLPLHHRHMAGASLQLQRAVKLLDSGAVRATRFLWRYPVARVILLFYMVFVHLFLMYLLHRLQKQADAFAAQEVAASMGLTNPNLP